MRVRYADTDADGVVYYANYLTFFEVARVEWLRALGYPITEDPRARHHPAGRRGAPQVPASGARRRPPHGPRHVVDSVGPASFAFDYEVAREDGLLLVTGSTRLAVCERETTRACAMPPWLRDLFASLPLDGTDLTMGNVYRFPGGEMPPDFETQDA